MCVLSSTSRALFAGKELSLLSTCRSHAWQINRKMSISVAGGRKIVQDTLLVINCNRAGHNEVIAYCFETPSLHNHRAIERAARTAHVWSQTKKEVDSY